MVYFYHHYYEEERRLTTIYVEQAQKKIYMSVKSIEDEGKKENKHYENIKKMVVEWEKKQPDHLLHSKSGIVTEISQPVESMEKS